MLSKLGDQSRLGVLQAGCGAHSLPGASPGKKLAKRGSSSSPWQDMLQPWLCPAVLKGWALPCRDKVLPFSWSLSQAEAVPATSRPDNQAAAGQLLTRAWMLS